jgi:hypothetical protein
MTSRPGTRNTGTTVLSLLLIVAMAAAAILLAIQLRPDAPIRFAWGDPEGVDCPQGVGTPACFRFIVTNLGNRPSGVQCHASVSEGARATFLNGAPTYESLVPIEPGGGLELTVKVDPGVEGTAPAPSFSCTAV